MALVTISGYPCSGKSKRALQLQHLLERHAGNTLPVAIVNEETLGIDVSAFDEAKTEKQARANLLSATVRCLANDRITICDAMNSIKGFRYQLYCAAREVSCRTLTIHVAAPPPQCIEWNSRRAIRQYKQETLENLISRFEEPSFATRWDSPLLTVPWEDDRLPEEAILQAVFKGDLRPPNQATERKTVSTGGYLQRLDSVGNAIIAGLLSAQTFQPGGGETRFNIELPSGAQHTITIQLPAAHPVAAPQLQRLRRQYGLLNKQTTGAQADAQIADSFASYLHNALK